MGVDGFTSVLEVSCMLVSDTIVLVVVVREGCPAVVGMVVSVMLTIIWVLVSDSSKVVPSTLEFTGVLVSGSRMLEVREG